MPAVASVHWVWPRVATKALSKMCHGRLWVCCHCMTLLVTTLERPSAAVLRRCRLFCITSGVVYLDVSLLCAVFDAIIGMVRLSGCLC